MSNHHPASGAAFGSRTLAAALRNASRQLQGVAGKASELSRDAEPVRRRELVDLVSVLIQLGTLGSLLADKIEAHGADTGALGEVVAEWWSQAALAVDLLRTPGQGGSDG